MKPYILFLLITISSASFAQVDVQVTNIRKNYQKVNSIKKWTKVDTVDLEQSTEGGILYRYYLGDTLKKMSERNYGENGQGITEYYATNKELFFIYDKEYNYNRPLYWDSARMKENKDNQVFNLKKSKIDISRFYFDKGKLIEWIDSKNKVHTKRTDTLIQSESGNEEHYKYLLLLGKKKGK
jgi:hypothetical protein